MTDQEHVMHRMVNGRCPACVAASGGEAHIVLAEGGGYVIGGGGGGGFSPEVTEDRRPYVELAEGGASKGGASYAGGGVRADSGVSSVTATSAGGNSHERRGTPTTVTCAGGGGGNVGDPVDVSVTDKQWSNKLSGLAACHITSKITPGTNGKVTIHLECEEDTSKWLMVHFTADDWDLFKKAGDLMLDRAIRMTDR